MDKNAFYAAWRVEALSKPKRFLESTRVARWIPDLKDKKPSYVPSRVFALTLLENIHEIEGEFANLHTRAEALVADPATKPAIKRLVAEALKEADLVSEAAAKVEAVQKSLETAFDEAMERVSGWYKRRIQLVLFAIALVIVGTMNADSFAIGQRLWKDD